MIFFLCALIFISAFLSGSETALFSLSPLTLKSYRSTNNKRLLLIGHLMERPREVLVTIMMLNMLANISIQNTVSTIFDPFESFLLKVMLPLALTLIFGEFLPKSFALPNHTQIAYLVSPMISRLTRLLRPIREPMTLATSWISRALFFFLRQEKEISPQELRHVLVTSEERGILTALESELIGGVLDLQNAIVREHVRPREEIVYYDMEEPLSELVHLFTDLAITRIPISKGNLENLQGIFSAQSFFLYREKIKEPSDLLQFMDKPFFVPESSQCWATLRNLRAKREHIAIVVDEYGSISGLVTQEDLMEVVIGEIEDSREQNRFTRSSEDEIIASGKLELAEFKEIFGIPLKSTQNIVTLAGWLIEQLGDIPVSGTKFTTDQFLFYILAAEPHRIRRIYVRRLKK